MRNLLLLTVTLFLFSCHGCKKEKSPSRPQLPPITHEGKNILACKINGEIMIASGVPSSLTVVGTSYTYSSDSTIHIMGSQASPNFYLTITFKFSYNKSNFKLTDSLNPPSLHPNKGYLEKAFNTSGSYMYSTDSFRNGNVNILLYNGNILSGTFAFDAINNFGEVVHITEGRFDISKQ
jgi:hypothetical protein